MRKALKFILAIIISAVITGLLVGLLGLAVYAGDAPRRKDAKIAKAYWETNLKNQEWQIIAFGLGRDHILSRESMYDVINIQVQNKDKSQTWTLVVLSLTFYYIFPQNLLPTNSKIILSYSPEAIRIQERKLYYFGREQINVLSN